MLRNEADEHITMVTLQITQVRDPVAPFTKHVKYIKGYTVFIQLSDAACHLVNENKVDKEYG